MRVATVALILTGCGQSTPVADASASDAGSNADVAVDAANPCSGADACSCYDDAGASCTQGSEFVLDSFCSQVLHAPLQPGPCAPGYVGCCTIGASSPYPVIDCTYPPLDLDAAAAICAEVDGSFSP